MSLPHIVYYVAASLDGRIAGPADALDFLETLAEPERFGDDAFDAFFETVDALVMGASTYRVIRKALDDGALGEWPYGERPTVVMSRTLSDVETPGGLVRGFAGAPRDLVGELAEVGYGRVWLVGGGALAGAFLQEDLVDEIVLTIAPTVVGAGPALADSGELPLRQFKLTNATRGANSVALTYARDR